MDSRRRLWTSIVLIAVLPLVAALCLALWRSPFPISEAVALFEDVARGTASRFLIPDTSYYRPLFHLTLWTIWHDAPTLEARLALIKLLHIVPMSLLIAAFIWHVRPRTGVEAAAAAVAVAVLMGSPGFRDNLEIPLSYTAVGMPLALIVWMLLTREPRWWRGAAILLLAFVAIGFKEQGLVLVPLILVAWLTRAPGASRGLAVAVTMIAVAYVALRLQWRGKWPMFEQAVGLGFHEFEPQEAIDRYGSFPYFLYAYSSLSTVLNVLLSEPTRGVFSTTWLLMQNQYEPWQLLHLLSSTALTIVIVWWGVGAMKAAGRGWSLESRTFAALIVVLLACGGLSFNYSRDRLGGMATVFYALAAFFALRACALRTLAAPRARLAVAGVLFVLLATAWEARAIGTVETTRLTAWRNQQEWLTSLTKRRTEFAGRDVYLQIMESMIDQGLDPRAPEPTHYPEWIDRTLGLPVRPAAPPATASFAYSLADAIEQHDVRRAARFIRDGQDPNALIAAQHPVLTGGRSVLVSPLVWAVGLQETKAVYMLFGFGARIERDSDRRASCLADRLGYREIAELLRSNGAAPAASCAAARTDEPPLLAYAAVSSEKTGSGAPE